RSRGIQAAAAPTTRQTSRVKHPEGAIPVQAGSRIGVYDVVERIGSGGMGDVYRARDLRLDRDVALKVLPVEFANDSDRLTRFRREAKVLASLNHPNIAQIYGLEESPGVCAIVMELVS